MVKIGNDTYVYGIIYIIINIYNTKIYIGQTTSKNGFYSRYRGGNFFKYTNNSYLKKSIEKYGEENFMVIPCFETANNKIELDEKEKFWISFFNSTNRTYGYNRQIGGSGGEPTQDVKQKMSDNNWLKNGGTPWNKGKKNVYTEKTLVLMRENHADFALGKHPRAKKVICKTTNKIFQCIREGANYYNCDESSILKCCKGTQKSCGKLENNVKLTWEFYE